MTRKHLAGIGLVVAFVFVGCAGPGADPWGSADMNSGEFALTNTTSSNPEGLLRGQGLKIYTEVPSSQLSANTIYEVVATNDNTGDELGRGEFRTTSGAEIYPYALIFDAGQYGFLEDGHNIRVAVEGEDGTELSRIISLGVMQLPGWDVAETEPPEVYVCDSNGEPANAFAVGGQDPGETVGEVHVCGNTFPEGVRGGTVDVYIVEAQDEWMGASAPQEGEASHVFGPVAVPVDSSGQIRAEGLGWTAELGDVGIYDLLVDVDGDGEIRETFAIKDGGDGIGEQVGFTVQYSQAWIRARGERHILVNIAYSASSRSGGEWANEFNEGEHIYLYLNPPVMHRYHFGVTKYIVPHQGFDEFWNNPAMETGPGGCVPFEHLAAIGMAVPVQRGCTNTGPIDFGPAEVALDATGHAITAYDVVFDRNGDGCYMAGEDLLDVGSASTSGDLLTFDEYSRLEEADQVGFRVVP